MKCFNWKVIAALGAIVFGIYALAPGAATAALPLLVLAVCPLSMLLMMRAMGSMGGGGCKTKKEGDDSDNDEVAQLGGPGGRPANRAAEPIGGEMSALVAVLGCTLMMVVVLAGFAWYALSGRRSGGEASEVSALRAEVAALAERQADAYSDVFRGRR